LIRAGKSRSRPRVLKPRSDAARQAAPARGAQSRVIRIIGGSWRGRRFRFADVAEIRPTPDRVRETLFNWLGSRVVGARCLDLFAGSGALGLEALSRGATSAVFVEQNTLATRALAAFLAELNAQAARVEREDALRFLERPATPFDIVFLDPPFSAGLLQKVADRLERRDWLAPDALVYVESSAREALPPLPGNWQLLKAKQAGEVGYHLFARAARGHEPE
jgi:16S rRNA (guanine966-N2)-methyltransferase